MKLLIYVNMWVGFNEENINYLDTISILLHLEILCSFKHLNMAFQFINT